MQTSTLTAKGQLQIPKRLRLKYGMEAGGKIALVETAQGVMLKPVNADYIDDIIQRIGKNFPTAKEYKKWKAQDLDIESNFLNEPIITYKKKTTKAKKK